MHGLAAKQFVDCEFNACGVVHPHDGDAFRAFVGLVVEENERRAAKGVW